MRKTKPLPSVEYLNQLFTLNGETGELMWNTRLGNPRFNSKNAGKIAGTVVNGYIQIRLSRVAYYAHQIVFKMKTGLDVPEVDHKNGNGLDNRPCNLIDGSNSVNAKNKRRISTNTSGVMGVYSVGHKWQAKMSGKSLGMFSSFDEAVAARKEAEKLNGYSLRHGCD